MLTSWNGSWYRFGGTGSGSPPWSAITALADQLEGKRLGNVDEALHCFGKSASPSLHYPALPRRRGEAPAGRPRR